ncbi:Atrochrysone carboxyl ACP thioesterase [Frankliniella fusca]|uniref:Atrochrysone carboxyl ACP thioesterase n=1 Tax=Frankliniella fusca TaxID=407009 RepID=A0AAE1HUU5_9NEOP|nr:Atrochrysone carboxyl ACP thioesterase [Frankliniella fusca]
MGVRDAYALSLTCCALRERVMPLLQLRYRDHVVRLYSASGVYESVQDEYDTPHILQTAECVYRIKLPPVLVPEQRYFLDNLKNVRAKVRAFSLSELAVRLFRWHSLEYHTESCKALDLAKAADIKMCGTIRKCLIRDFVVPYLEKSKNELEVLDLARFSPWTAKYLSGVRSSHFPKLRTLILRFPYAEQQDIPYLWHPEAYGNTQDEHAAQNPRMHVRYEERQPEGETFYAECTDSEEVTEVECAECTRSENKTCPDYYVHENCTPFGLEVCSRIAEATREVISRVAPKIKKVVIVCPTSSHTRVVDDSGATRKRLGHALLIDSLLEMLRAYPQWKLSVAACRLGDNVTTDGAIQRIVDKAHGRYEVHVSDCDGSCMDYYNGSAVAVILHRSPLSESAMTLDEWHVGNLFRKCDSYINYPVLVFADIAMPNKSTMPLLKQICDAVEPLQPAAGLRAPRCKLLLERTYDLNNSGSKILTLGVDATRQFRAYVMIESQSRCGIQLQADAFFNITYESEFSGQVSNFLANPRTYDGPTPQIKTSEFEVTCMCLSDGSAAVRYKSGEKSYVILGAVTWHRLQRFHVMLKRVYDGYLTLCEPEKLAPVLLPMLKELCGSASLKAVSTFDCSQGAYRFVSDHAPQHLEKMSEQQEWIELIMELIFKQSDVLARMLMYAYNERVMKDWTPEVL